MSDDTLKDGRISIMEYGFMALSWAAWGVLFFGYVVAAICVLVEFSSRPGAGQVETSTCLLSLIPLAGLGLSLLPVWLHRRGKPGPAMAIWALSLVLWLPAVVGTAVIAVL